MSAADHSPTGPAADWPAALGRNGMEVTGRLGAGMDGAVYALADGSVAKVWQRQSSATLERLGAFYGGLDAAGLPFATPLIHEIRAVDGVPVTVERRLGGRPLQAVFEATPPPERALRTFVDILAALSDIEPPAAAWDLSVMDEPLPFHQGGSGSGRSWPEALVRLLDRRVAVFGSHLRSVLPDFDDLLGCVVAGLRCLPPAGPGSYAPRVIHGDLCPPNLLVDDDLRVISVLDWGYLTTAGDPAFDASLAAGFFDMYGPHARAVDDRLTGWMTGELGHQLERLHLYRAAYAIAAAHAYDPAGSDGHFAWCVGQLRRADVRSSLDLA